MGISNIGGTQPHNINANSGSGFGTGKVVALSIPPAELGVDPNRAPKSITLSDEQIERNLFKHFGLDVNEAKRRLESDNPFARVSTQGDNIFKYNSKTRRYERSYNVQLSLYQKLSGTASRLRKQIKQENTKTPGGSANETDAAKKGIDNTQNRRADLNRKLDERSVDLRRLTEQAGVMTSEIGIPTDPNELKSFFVSIPDDTKLKPEDSALLTLIKDNFGGGNLDMWAFREILSLSKDAGVKVRNLELTGTTARFDLSVADILRIKIARIAVQEKVNRVEKAGRDAIDNNEISSFIRGVVKGAYSSVAGTIGLIADLPGTMKALWQVVAHPVETFNALYQELGETWDEFKKAESSKKAEMIGELVGSAVVEILIGKGIGKAAGILTKTKTGAQLLEKTKALRSATAIRIAETFSDEAADIAARRARRRMATQIYGGIPADVLGDMGIVAGNKIKNGAIQFSEFAKQMVDEFGERVKPALEKLYVETMEKYGKSLNRNELQKLDLEGIKVNPQAITEPPRSIRNQKLSGKRHPVTDVPFDSKGYPIFEAQFEAVLPKEMIGRGVSDSRQFIEGTRQLKKRIQSNPNLERLFTRGQLEDIMAEKDKIRDLTWHHHQDGVRIQLVDEWTHNKTGHDGGRKNTGGRP